MKETGEMMVNHLIEEFQKEISLHMSFTEVSTLPKGFLPDDKTHVYKGKPISSLEYQELFEKWRNNNNNKK